MNDIRRITDDELRQQVFRVIVATLEAEAEQDPATTVENRTSVAFALSRHGNLLTIHQAEGQRLVSGELEWKYTPDADAPWTFSVSRTTDGSRLQLTPGPEGSVDEIARNIVRTFIDQTEPK